MEEMPVENQEEFYQEKIKRAVYNETIQYIS